MNAPVLPETGGSRQIFRGILLLASLVSLRCGEPARDFTIWIGGAPQEIAFWEETVRAFNAAHHRSLRFVRQPTYSDQRLQNLVISLSAGENNPDLFLMDVVWLRQCIMSDWLEPLDRWRKADSLDTKNFFEHLLDQVDRYEGSLYALPVFMDAGLLYVRTDLLKKHGFDPPRTWKELVQQAQHIQAAERKNNPHFNGFLWQGAQYEGLVCTFAEFIFSNGGSFGRADSFVVHTPQNVEALQFMGDLIQVYGISPQNTYTDMKEEEVRRSFQRGDAVFERIWSYAWNLHNRPESDIREAFTVHPLPSFSGDASSAALGGWHIGISSVSDRKDEAWEFIRYVTSYEFQKQMLLEIGWNPARSDVYHDTLLLRRLPHLPVLEKAFSSSVSRPVVPHYAYCSEVLQRYVNRSLAGSLSAEEALASAQRELDALSHYYVQ